VSELLSFRAGASALRQIRENGLRPEDVRIVPGAAGGPKFLILSQIDRYLFGHWLAGRGQAPVFMLGSSVGAWRFAAIAQDDPIAAIEKFDDAYIEEEYASWSAEDISAGCWRVLGHYLNDAAIERILTHPVYRLGWLVGRARHLNIFETRLLQSLGLGLTALGNFVHPGLKRTGFQQMLFRDGRDRPPYVRKLPQVSLSVENIRPSLIATGAVPLVMKGVPDIPGAPRGIYRDGGVVDYHLDLDWGLGEGIVLYPHFTERVVPGWFDKKLTWRKPKARHMDRVLLIAPSQKFIDSLPDGKIPDRIDFQVYDGREAERRRAWRACVARTIELRDALVEALEGNRIREWVQPLST